MENIIKINYYDMFEYDGVSKLRDTKIPLDGIYEDEDGTIYHFKNGKYHNENGPSYIANYGYKEYCINGKYHRTDGPAVIWPNGDYGWRINGHKIYNETMNNWLTENDIPLDWNIWSDSDKMLFALHWNDYNI